MHNGIAAGVAFGCMCLYSKRKCTNKFLLAQIENVEFKFSILEFVHWQSKQKGPDGAREHEQTSRTPKHDLLANMI